MKISLRETKLGLRNSSTRIPFRYGTACLTRCPQAVLQVNIEVSGRQRAGYSGDCLPPSWFDKSPVKDFAAQIQDMLAVIEFAQIAFRDGLRLPCEFFPVWREVLQATQDWARSRGYTPLLASFGVSLVERAVIDAICRYKGLSFSETAHRNLIGIDAGQIHHELSGLQPTDWLPAMPMWSVFVRHTVGLGDPLTLAEVAHADRLQDGFPQTLEQYVESTGVCYFKIKVSNQLDRDLDRLNAIAAIVEGRHGPNYGCTLDGNEQYKRPEEFDELIDAIAGDVRLGQLWGNVLAIEQPLDRKIALDPKHTDGVRTLGRRKPVIIDESDGELNSYVHAIELGYRGVSSKNCKGPIKSLLNAGITWVRNQHGRTDQYLMTGEDLCSVGIIPTQSDLCLAATLGLEHVERNGHHYHPGLNYLPVEQQRAALAAHGDLYAEQHGRVAPRLVDGRFEIGSLQCIGFGFAVEPDMQSFQLADEWDFASLGLP